MIYVHSASRWQRQPAQALGIDPSHPLAEEIRFFVSFASLAAFDHVNSALGTRNGSPSIGPYAGSARAASIASGSNDFYEFAHRPETEILGDITLAWRGIIATGGAFRHFAGKHASNGGINCPFDFRTTNAASPKVTLVRSSQNTFTSFDSVGTIPLAVPTTVEVVKGALLADTPSFYVAGVDAGSTTSGGSGTASGSAAALRIGRRPDGEVQQNGHTEYVVGWARRLTEAELREFRLAPYALLRPVASRTYFLATAAPEASLSATLAALALSSEASIAAGPAASVTATLAALSLTSEAIAAAGPAATLSATLAPVTLASEATASSNTSATLSATLAAVTLSSAGEVVAGPAATLSATLAPVTLVSEATTVTATLASLTGTLGALSLVANAELAAGPAATLVGTLGAVTLTASAEVAEFEPSGDTEAVLVGALGALVLVSSAAVAGPDPTLPRTRRLGRASLSAAPQPTVSLRGRRRLGRETLERRAA